MSGFDQNGGALPDPPHPLDEQRPPARGFASELAPRRKTDEELFRRAYYDDLTGLPNRSHLEQAVAELMERGIEGFALAFVDLDGFKQINDYYGHAVGDEILIKTARRFEAGLDDRKPRGADRRRRIRPAAARQR